ncbi:Ig-like domain-containing protein [Algoriphagus halophilus]|uniref:Right handed beta helix region n=1 Tax=Algoriphagus halophilus TaxID=226505 RepID=A0A1N6DS47_9BACT|nr:Ig-like domain-containing protein [Algoriphagus halophilus]SIN73523.1 Right handed beta helix region [Algoriphagus halophilus]
MLYTSLIPSKSKLIGIFFSIVLVAVLTVPGFATDYYFSSVSGDDSRSAIEAQNPSTPWKSIEKLNSFGANLKGGDRILFKSGETFYGAIHIIKSGSTGAPLQFTSYGTGPKPIITSLVKIDQWNSVGNGNYQADLSGYNLSRVQILLLNGQLQEIGRYPNAGSSNGGYATIASSSGSNFITTQGSNPYSGSTGEVVIRKNNWIIDRHQISSISGTSISFATNESVYDAKAGHGYFLQNHISLLDQPGEWSYDPSTKKLTVNLSGYSLPSVEIAVATKDYLITNQQYTTNLTFSNLHLKGANTNLIHVLKSDHVTIENCDLEYAGENGINSNSIPNYIIQNNRINASLNNGIFILYGSPGAIIRNNVITNTMQFQGMGRSSDLNGIGIYLGSDGNNSLIEKNTIDHVGYNGIHFGGNYTVVKNNFVNDFCVFKQDGGGIYTNSDGFRDRNNIGREIVGNIILNGKGSKLGTLEEVELAEGIYLDDNSAGIKVANNTVAFVSGKGIFLHNANNIEITNNLFYKAKSQVQFTHDFLGDPIRNVSISNNKFSSIEQSEKVYAVYSDLDDITSVGTINSNYFLDPYNIDFFIHTKTASEGSKGVDRNLKNWSSNFGHDSNSTKPDLNLPTYEVTSSNLVKQSEFNDASVIAGIYSANGKIVSNGISGNSYVINPNSTNQATVYIQFGQIQVSDDILVEFDLKSPKADTPIELFLEGTYNLDKGAGNKIVATKTEATTYQVLLSSLAARSNESLVLRIPSNAIDVYLDNLKISKVKTSPIDKGQQIFFEYNYSESMVQVPLDGTYVDAKNETFSGSVSIPAFGSVLLAKVSTDAPEQVNQAPSVILTQPANGQVFTLGTDQVQLIANAQDPEGEIKSVEFYSNGQLISTITEAPYTFDWTTITAGSYEVYAKVFDLGGLNASSEVVKFTVEAANQAPTISLTQPSNNQVFTLGLDAVQLVANAQDPEGEIKSVEFYSNGQLISTVTTAPYSYDWSTITAGSYVVYAKVFDLQGLSATSEKINFAVEGVNEAPSISLTQPINNQIFTLGAEAVQLVANAQDPEGEIKNVEFYSNGQLISSITSAPYTYDWSTITTGTYQVYAKVFDLGGLSATSEIIKFSVEATNQAPSVSLTQPNNNQVFTLGKDAVQLVANAQDPEGEINSVEFYSNGQLISTVTTAPYTYDWSTITAGTYQVYAKVFDLEGLNAISETVTFSVELANEAPSISLTQPINNQVFTLGSDAVQLVANAQDPEGEIKSVEFYSNGKLLTSVSKAPFVYDWSTITTGTYRVSAKVIDMGGLTANSETINFTVESSGAKQDPSIILTQPYHNQVFEFGKEKVQLVANPNESVGKINNVEFYSNGQLLGKDSKSPYVYNWSSIDVGAYEVYAKVNYRGNINSGVSETINFSVEVANQAPSITLKNPNNNQVFVEGKDLVQFEALASDPEGEVKTVEFYSNNQLLSRVSSAPYIYNWSGIEAGNYSVHAVVIDQADLIGTSETIDFTVEAQVSLPQFNGLMVSPSQNAVFQLGDEPVILNTNAASSGLEIQKVEYSNWGMPIATVSSAPFDFTWSSIEAGDFNVSAIITDIQGNTYATDQVFFTVEAPANLAPEPDPLTVSMAQPLADQVFTLGQDVVNLQVSISDPSNVSSVQYFNWGNALVTTTAQPFDFTWSSIEAGDYKVSAVVTDLQGTTNTTEEVFFSVTEPAPQAEPLTVSMAQPLADQLFTLGQDVVNLQVSISDPSNVTSVQFFNWGYPLVSTTAQPFDFTWSSIEAGDYKVSAIVTDLQGTTYTTEEVFFSVTEPAPQPEPLTVSMAQPLADQVFVLGQDVVNLQVSISDPSNVTSVQFFNWGYPLVSTTAQPFDFTWSSIEAGDYKVSAIVTDLQGTTYTTEEVFFSVTEPDPQPVPLTVSMAQPLADQVFVLGQDVVNLQVSISDPSNVTSVQFFNWGYPLVSTTAQPFDFTWSQIEAGEYSVYAEVTDLAGNITSTETVRFTVSESNDTSEVPTEPTSLVMTQPYEGQVFELGNQLVTLKAVANGDVSNVQFFNWYLPLVNVNDPSLEFDWTKIEVGNYLVYAQITDSKGNVIESEPVGFQVIDPSLKVTEGSVSENGAMTEIQMNPTDLETKEIQKAEEITPSNYGIKMGPNPADSFLRIFFDDYPSNLDVQMSIVDMTGDVQLTEKGNTNDGVMELDVNAIRPGVYVVKINVGDKYVQTKKLIII